ncbi:MAG: hypothetical protein ALAOOOJD_00266 [bacterium]|nr:hypothetical protein [bacterium]
MKAKIKILLGLVLALAVNAGARQTITPTNLNGWAPANVRTNATVAITGAQPRSGLGSLEFTTNTITSGQDKADFEKIWGVVPGRTLGSLTALSFEFYRSNASTTAGHFAPVLRFYYQTTSGETGLLIWEPIYNGYSTITTNTWISADIFTGNFWMRAFTPSRTIDDYNVSLAEWMANTDEEGSPIDDDGDSDVPHVLSASTYIVGINVGVGSGWGATFLGYVDNVEIKWGADEETANFELPPPCTTDCYVDAATGNDANGGTNPTTDAKKTVQNAVNTVNVSGNVHVASGTYTEQVTVTKSLNLIGAGAVTTTIKAPSTIPVASNPASTVIDINGSGVTVDIGGFTVSGPGPTGCGSIGTGIFVRGGAHADIHDNKILDIRDNPISGCQNGVGIQVGRNLYSTTGTATIKNNEISGYQKNGITVDNTGSYAEISDNTITGAGAVTFIAQNGIQISRGATGDIKNNTVQGHSYTPFTAISTGMLFYQADANTDDNDVLENQIGIYHINGSGTHKLNNVSASGAGTGSPSFWGIVVDPAGIPRAKPSPLDEETSTLGKSSVTSQLTATYTTMVDQNTITGDGVTANCVGLEMDALGTDVLNVTATKNTITKWDYGVYLYKDVGATLNANIIDCNQIYDNMSYGAYNSTGVTANAVGNWWGAASGPTHVSNPSGTGDVISDDLTFAPWGATASCGGLLSNNFVFLANECITITRAKQSASMGNMHSNNLIYFLRGDPNKFTGDLTAVGNIKIDKEIKIIGDATAGGKITLGEHSSITGTKTSYATVAAIPLPTPAGCTPSGTNRTVKKDGSLTLPPGSYGKVIVGDYAKLKLSAGNYCFAVLETKTESVLQINVAGGPVNITVMTSLKLGKELEMQVSSGEAGSSAITFNALQSTKVLIDQGSYVLGSFIAPNAEVVLAKNVSFRGSICAKKITVERDVVFLHHTSPGSLPKPEFEGNKEISNAQAPVTTYELEQNYPNPFNPSTTISFALLQAGEVNLAIYNIYGQLVRQLVAGQMTAGRHSVIWNGKDERGQQVASGMYLYVLKAGEFTAQRKLVLMK